MLVLNRIAFEMGKVNGTKKADLEKGLIDCVNSYYSMKRLTGNMWPSNGTKRSNELTYLRGVSESSLSGGSRSNQQCVTHFATASISQLMQAVINQYSIELSDAAASSQSHNQPSSYNNSKCHANFITFVLDVLLCHVISCPGLGKDDPFMTFIYDDIKVLGAPLLKLIILLKSGQRHIRNEGKKESGVKNGRENFHQALICFKELVCIYLESPQLPLLLQDLVSVSTAEHDLEEISDKLDNTDDEKIRSMEAFITRTLKPLLSDFLALSSYCEAEVKQQPVTVIRVV